MYSTYKDGLTELFRILIQTVVLQVLRQAFDNRNRNVMIIDLSAMQLTDNSDLKTLIGVVEQVEGPQLAIFLYTFSSVPRMGCCHYCSTT